MVKRFAAIYIGSSKCDLVVGQRGKGSINVLDRAMYPIDFGVQSFTNGTIGFQSVYALCGILNEYIEIAQASAVDEIQILGTAALREATNRDYVLDQIRVFTGGHQVRLLEKEEEIELIFRYLHHLCGESLMVEGADTVIAAITSGNIAVGRIHAGSIVALYNTEMGYLKIKELFHTMEERTGNFDNLLSDYMAIRMKNLTDALRCKKIGNLVVTSHEADTIARLLGMPVIPRGYYTLTKEALLALRGEMAGLYASQLMKKYPGLGRYQAETIRHTLILFIQLLKDTQMTTVHLARLSIGDALLEFAFNITKNRQLEEWIDRSTMASVKAMAKGYSIDRTHADAVEKIALRLFSALRTQYQMGKEEQRYLSMAAQLLDIGSFVGNNPCGELNRRIIESSDIIGLKNGEKRLLGRIVDGVRLETLKSLEEDDVLKLEERMVVAKVIAILKLATALDKSHKQRVGKIRCHLDAKIFEISVQATKNVQLEEYFFAQNAWAMKEVYGIEPLLRVRRIAI